jgi:hypothetical protein
VSHWVQWSKDITVPNTIKTTTMPTMIVYLEMLGKVAEDELIRGRKEGSGAIEFSALQVGRRRQCEHVLGTCRRSGGGAAF